MTSCTITRARSATTAFTSHAKRSSTPLRILRDDPELSFDLLLDVTAIDYLGQPDDFETNLQVWDQNRATMRQPTAAPS